MLHPGCTCVLSSSGPRCSQRGATQPRTPTAIQAANTHTRPFPPAARCALTGILHSERPDFSRRIVTTVLSDLRVCLAAEQPPQQAQQQPGPRPTYRAKQLLRFLAALHATNVVPAAWILAAMGNIVDAAAGGLAEAAEAAAAAGAPDGGAAVQPWSDFLVYAVLAALPWCGKELAAAGEVGGGAEGEGMEGEGAGAVGEGAGGCSSLDALLGKVEAYMGQRPVAVDEALRPMFGARSEEDLAAR